MRPNLFEYASSELSQDAFLCWLLKWADPAHESDDSRLHRLGRQFLAALYSAAGKPSPEGSVAVVRQRDDMDIVALVGDRDVIVIEDKIHSSEHSEQLKRYSASIKQLHPHRQLLPIFLKTGEQSTYANPQRDGWIVFRRRDLLEVLRTDEDIGSDVVRDFRERLEALDREISSFRSTKPESWGWLAWQGFFEVVKEEFPDAEWNYVPNKSGGFLGLWWGWQTIPGGKLYLQLEEARLLARVEPVTGDTERRASLRNRWSDRVIAEITPLKFARPPRFGSGTTMTVAQTAEPYLKSKPDGSLDLTATLRVLRQATSEISKLAKREE